MIGTLRGAGFSLTSTIQAFSVLDSYIYGFGRQQLNMSVGGGDSIAETTEAFKRAIPPDEFPHLTEMVDWALRGAYDESSDFEFGLDLILEGLQRVLDAQDAGKS